MPDAENDIRHDIAPTKEMAAALQSSLPAQSFMFERGDGPAERCLRRKSPKMLVKMPGIAQIAWLRRLKSSPFDRP